MVPCDALATLVTIGIAPLAWILVTHTILVLVTWKPPHQITTIVGTATLHAVSAIDFTRSGNTHLRTGSMRYAGFSNNYWSNVAHSIDKNAYYLTFSASDMSPDYYYSRWDGFTVRCFSS